MSDGNRPAETGLLPLLVVGIILIGGSAYAIWHFKHAQLAAIFLKWKYVEITPFILIPYAEQVRVAIGEALARPDQIPFSSLIKAGNYTGVFYAPILLALSVWIGRKALKHPILKANRVMDPQMLLKVQSRNHPPVIPVIDRDLSDDASKEWAVSMRPEEYARKHSLVVDGKYDRGRARTAFLNDLGRRIEHPDDLRDHEKALFSAFCARIVDGRKASKNLLDALNMSARNKKSRPNYSLAQEAYRKYRNNPKARDVLRRHPYARTFLMALLEQSRESGVLPPAEFLWLKPNDRALWYPLNSLGRKTPFVEAAGVFAQFQAEKLAASMSRELVETYVERAVDALGEYLKNIGEIEEEDENVSYSS